MFDTLQKFAEIRKLDRQSLVRDFNLYPSAENLLTLERKYGDSLSLYDLAGIKPKKNRRHKGGDGVPSTTDGRSEGMSYETRTVGTVEDLTIRSATAPENHSRLHNPVKDDTSSDDDDQLHQTQKRKAPTDCHNKEFSQSIS